MNVSRGDVVLVRLPFASGHGGKIRPVLVIQSDHNNVRLMNTIVAGITSNTSRAQQEQTQYLIDVATSDGVSSGLRFDSAVVCEHVATIELNRILKRIGSLSSVAMQRIDDCLKASLGIT